MKSKEFLLESIGKERVQNWAKMIKKDCQPYLNSHSFQNHMLRGLGEEKDPFVNKRVRLDDRNPVDTSKYLHKGLNDVFKQQYGAPYRNALFVSGDYNLPSDYGRIYKIFPIGEFKYIWGGADDLYNEYKFFDIDRDEWNNYIRANPIAHDDVNDSIASRRIKFKFDAFLRHVKDNLKYKSTDLYSALNSGWEIMIRCKSYYAVDDNLPEHIIDYLMEVLDEK